MAEICSILGDEELNAAYALHTGAFFPGSPDFLSPASFKSLARAKNGGLLGAFSPTGQVSGYLLYRTVFPEAEVLSMAVNPKYRGKGMGTTLLETLIDTLGNDGYAAVFLEVGENNPAARALYRKFGAEEVGSRKSYYKTPDGTPETALLKKINLR